MYICIYIYIYILVGTILVGRLGVSMPYAKVAAPLAADEPLCVYIYIYICMYMYVYVCVYIYIYIHNKQ